MSKLIITAALTGAEVTKADQPNLPISPVEIAEAAFECYKAGAGMVHVHARNADGTSSQSKDIYKEILEEIKKRCNIIVQVSTGGAVGMTPEERLQPVTLNPEMATLSMGTCNFGDDVFMNHPKDIEIFYDEMMKHGVKPEFEIFDTGMLTTTLKMLKRGRFASPAHFDFVLGVPGGMAGTPDSLMYLLSQVPNDATWTVAGIGASELSLGVLGIVLGGHVRVGFEDNVFNKKGELAVSNAQLVERIARISREMNREVATPNEAREILGLKK